MFQTRNIKLTQMSTPRYYRIHFNNNILFNSLPLPASNLITTTLLSREHFTRISSTNTLDLISSAYSLYRQTHKIKYEINNIIDAIKLSSKCSTFQTRKSKLFYYIVRHNTNICSFTKAPYYIYWFLIMNE